MGSTGSKKEREIKPVIKEYLGVSGSPSQENNLGDEKLFVEPKQLVYECIYCQAVFKIPVEDIWKKRSFARITCRKCGKILNINLKPKFQ